MKIEIIMSDGTHLIDNDTVGFWRQEVMARYLNYGVKIKQLLIDGNPFQPNADGYFMLFNVISSVIGGYSETSKGVGYVKFDTNRARILWEMPDNKILVEIKKPVPGFVKEIMVEREK